MFSIKQTVVTSKPELLYDESRVPAYSLPDCLVFQDGSRVSSKNDWIKKRKKRNNKTF